jgi:acyl-CoA reductase-like NAD-dependent aldehyde dehydrogenase
LEPFTDFKAACDKVNDSEYGLQAGIFTRDIHKAFYAFNNLHVGGCVINDIPSTRVDSQPYGGIKDSGSDFSVEIFFHLLFSFLLELEEKV